MRIDELARLLNGKVQGEGFREIRSVASLESAGPEDLTFAEGERALAEAARSRAGCILVREGLSIPARSTLAVVHPKLAFIRAVEALRPAAAPLVGLHPTAVVSAEAELAADVSVGPYAVIDRHVKVGPGTRLGTGVTLGEGVEIGFKCVLYPRVTVYPGVRLGNRVILHAGVVIGSDGFGYVFAEGRYHKFPQLGRVMVEDDVEIGSNTTVDRGSLGTTVIGEGTKIDNLCQIAHNVTIGRHCVIAALAGIAGGSKVGDYVVMGGRAGVSDHARIEDHAVIGGGSVVGTGKVIRKGTTVWGMPARPIAEFKKIYAHLSHLPELAQKVKEIYRRMPER